MRNSLVALALAALTGCSVVPRAPVVTKVLPPVELLQDCPVSDYRTMSNADLGNAVLVLKKDIATCNTDKAALRRWSESTKE